MLTILGGALSVAGIGCAAIAAIHRLARLREDRQTVLREVLRDRELQPQTGEAGALERLRDLGITATTLKDLIVVRQDVELAIVTDALANLRGLALVVLLGGVASTTGGVLSLWV